MLSRRRTLWAVKQWRESSGCGAALLGAMLAIVSAPCALAQSDAAGPLRPCAIAFDAAGDVYFADCLRHTVYQITLAGTLQIVAGSGVQGFNGDGGAATSARLDAPHGVAVASDGTVFIADTGNARVRAVRAGVISTVAGSGTPGFSGDGGAATAAALNRPWGLASAANGDLYIADSGNHRVRRLRAGLLSTAAGNGTQGRAGDGGPAASAMLDLPEGIAVSSEGSLLIADAGSSTVRAVSTAGVITTLAGTGVAGFSGDGGASAQARLFRPSGVAEGFAGEIYIADSGNQRVRVVAPDGTISTLVGAGMQGVPADGAAASSASLDGPDAVAVSPFGRVWITDARNRSVRAISTDARLFQPAGLVVRSSAVSATVTPAANGQSGVSVHVTAQAGTAQGTVRLYDGNTLVGTALLAEGQGILAAAFPSTRSLTLQYSGDVLNPAVSAALNAMGVQPNVLVATASAASTRFGESLPALSGTVDGIAAQDKGDVQIGFSTPATSVSPVGTYPIAASLSGPAASKYTVQVGPASGQLTILPQASSAAMLTPAPIGYDGLPLSVTATVGSPVSSRPTGSVDFLENGVLLTTAKLVNGSATGVLQTPTVGTHAVVARYAGDGNFLASQSSAQAITVNSLPDFTLVQASTAVPTMDPGASATFSLQVGAAPAPFTGAVAFSTSGVPAGWTARFAPAFVIPGTTGATVTLTLTAGVARWRTGRGSAVPWAVILMPSLLSWRKRRRGGNLVVTVLLATATALTGCGDRVASTADIVAPHPASFTVTGTATNLAGQVVTHSAVVRYMQP